MNRAQQLCLVILITLAGVAGCAGAGKQEPEVKDVPVFFPEHAPRDKSGPGDMPDLTQLWSPLAAAEAAGPVLRREDDTIQSLTLPFRFELWMPTGERTVLNGYLHRLRVPMRYVTARALQRAEEHMPAVKDVLMTYGLPQELAAFPLVLSAYEADGVSSLGVAGLWQLSPDTAREYGLVVDDGQDERLDPVKSTGAAAKHLMYLYTRFDDWQITLLAYREGEGTVRRAIDAAGAYNYESLAVFCRNNQNYKYALSEDALQNVPKFTAALMMLTNTKELGFSGRNILDIARQTKIEAEEENIPPSTRPVPAHGTLVDIPIN